MVNWVEVLEDKVYQLAKESHVELNTGIVRLLEKFGSLVESEAHARNSQKIRQRRLNGELVTTKNVVHREVTEFQRWYVRQRCESLGKGWLLRVYQHPETYLPFIRYQPFEDVPEMVIHIDRSYGGRSKGAKYGLCSYRYCQGRLTGSIARAANFLREYCTQRKWDISVFDLLKSWTNALEEIPLEERIKSKHAHRSKRKKSNRITIDRSERWVPKLITTERNSASLSAPENPSAAQLVQSENSEKRSAENPLSNSKPPRYPASDLLSKRPLSAVIDDEEGEPCIALISTGEHQLSPTDARAEITQEDAIEGGSIPGKDEIKSAVNDNSQSGGAVGTGSDHVVANGKNHAMDDPNTLSTDAPLRERVSTTKVKRVIKRGGWKPKADDIKSATTPVSTECVDTGVAGSARTPSDRSTFEIKKFESAYRLRRQVSSEVMNF